MKILFLSSGSRVPSARFRILPYLRYFREQGHHCVLANSFPQKYDYFPWMGFRPSQLLKRSVRWWHWLRAKLSSFDVVYIDREIFDNESMHMEQRFRDACGKLVIDIDDVVENLSDRKGLFALLAINVENPLALDAPVLSRVSRCTRPRRSPRNGSASGRRHQSRPPG